MQIKYKNIWLVLFLCFAFYGCQQDVSDSVRLEQRLESLRQAVNNKDIPAIESHLSNEDRLNANLTRKQLLAMAQKYFERFNAVTVEVVEPDWTIKSGQADLRMQVHFSVGNAMFKFPGQRYRVDTRWIKQQDEWYVQRIQWSRISP